MGLVLITIVLIVWLILQGDRDNDSILLHKQLYLNHLDPSVNDYCRDPGETG